MSNLYGRSCTPNLGGVSDSYTQEEVNRLLSAKANASNVYSRLSLDSRFSDLENSLINQISTTYVSLTDFYNQLNLTEQGILSSVDELYSLKEEVYSRQELDIIVSSIVSGPRNYVKIDPEFFPDNIIYPGDNDIVSLTLRGSSTNPIVQKWLSNSTDTIGYVSNNGSVVFERELTLGRLMSDGSAALKLNSKRITGIGSPLVGSDAVNLEYLQRFVLDLFDPSEQITESVADIVQAFINNHVLQPNPHEQYALTLDLGSAAFTNSEDYATSVQGDLADRALQPDYVATVAITGSYGDLDNLPELGTAAFTDSSDYATSAQGELADSAIQPDDPALSDSREWIADTIEESEAREGTSTTRRAFTAQRVVQATESWWSGGSDKTTSGRIDTSAPDSLSLLSISLGVRAFGIGVPGQKLFGVGPVLYGDQPVVIGPQDYYPLDPASGSFI